ncbi:MAG: cellulase family glycosylhydrolase [Rhodobacteraceae bacterium]|nr:cellulase family glycosylhydrolase [Paracoccaceae bacterium]
MAVKYTGVNLAGLEFGSGLDSNAYVSNPEHHYDFWANEAGSNVIRLPFKWERLQNEKYGEFDDTYLGYLKDAVEHAAERGMVLILDMHNYAKGFGSSMSSDDSLLPAYQDVWQKLAEEFKDDENVWFNIMNEPHSIDADRWMEFAQAATDKIRATGATNKIIVPTVDWSGAHQFNYDGNASKEAAYETYYDPANNFAFEVHQYLDGDSSGFSPIAQSGKGATVLDGATEWARENDFDLFLGEFGVSYDGGSQVEAQAMLQHMADNSDVYLGWTAWAAGEWWGDYYYGLGQGYEDTSILTPFMSGETGDFENNGVGAPTDPAPTDPAPTDPEPTDPEPTDPAPVDPIDASALQIVLAAVDPDSDEVLTRIEQDSMLDADMFGGAGLNLKANVYGEGMEAIRSVRVTMDNGESHLETIRPYAFFGDKSGDYFGGGLSAGAHSVTIEAFTNRAGTGEPVLTKSFDFEASGDIGDPNATMPTVDESLTSSELTVVLALVDPDTDEVLHRIKPGDSIDPADLPSGQLALKANVIGEGMASVETVRIVIDGEVERIDSARPYAVFGDEAGDYLAGALTSGQHNIVVEAYATAEAEGQPMVSGAFDVTALADFVPTTNAAPQTPATPDTTPDTSMDGLMELFLIDVETGAALGAIQDGGSVSVSDLESRSLRFEARVNDDSVESVSFALSGAASSPAQVQNVEDYNFIVDQGITAGTYTATVAAYDQDGAAGQKIEEEILSFTITEDSLVG